MLARPDRHFFLSGFAGSGKSDVIKYHLLPALVKQYGKDHVMVCSSTGMTAHFISGDTIHSATGVGRGRGSLASVMSNLPAPAWDRIKACAVMIIDEVSMVPDSLYNLVDGVFRKVRGQPKSSFGGAQTVAVGDYHQLPPVPNVSWNEVKAEYHTEPVDYAFNSKAWKDARYKCFRLTHCWR